MRKIFLNPEVIKTLSNIELQVISKIKSHKQFNNLLKLNHIKPIRIYNLNINKSHKTNIINFPEETKYKINNNYYLNNLKIRLFANNKKFNRLKLVSNTNNIDKSIKKNNIIDYRNNFISVYNQGDIGSCTANAICALVNYYKPNLKGSRLFLYYNERLIESSIDNDLVSNDDGASISTGMGSLISYGLCQETEWPYDIKKYNIKPPLSCYQTAVNNIALNIGNIKNDINSIKNALDNKCPFVVGLNIYSNFESDYVTKTGIVSMPDYNKDRLLGGHAVVCVGYDDIRKVWIMRNSWGVNWGDKGYFYLPYNYLIESNLASDLWCIYKYN